MKADEGALLGKKAIDQVAKTVREHARRLMVEQPHRGRWQNHRGGGGGELIDFTVLEVYCADAYDDWHLIVEATFYSAGCAKTPPGANDDGTYNVYDPCSYRLQMVAAELPGKTGWARYMWPLDPDVTCEGVWHLCDICYQPECA